MDAPNLTAYVRNKVRVAMADGHSQVVIASRAGVNRQKLNSWMLRPEEMDINLKTADRIVAACDDLKAEK